MVPLQPMHSYKYVQLEVSAPEEELREQLIALLAPLGFEGFEEGASALHAFGPAEAVDTAAVSDLLSRMHCTYSFTGIPEQNWNALWESNFDPVRVGDFAGVRAHFHPAFDPPVQYDVRITPKMSFGTGHHATTRLVMQTMQQLPIAGSTVLDFGTGTGILAILAALMGAAQVVAIDNDDWSIDNARENLEVNGTSRILLEKADNLAPYAPVSLLMANINKHILLEAAPLFASKVLPGGYLVLSGLLHTDEEDMCAAVPSEFFEKIETTRLGDWICIVFAKRLME